MLTKGICGRDCVQSVHSPAVEQTLYYKAVFDSLLSTMGGLFNQAVPDSIWSSRWLCFVSMMNNIECRRSNVCRFKLHNKRCLLTPLFCEISSALSVRNLLKRLLTDSILPSDLQDWHPDLQCRFNVHGKGSFERLWYSITISMPCGQFESAIKLPCLRIDFLFCDNESLFLLKYDRCWKTAA